MFDVLSDSLKDIPKKENPVQTMLTLYTLAINLPIS